MSGNVIHQVEVGLDEFDSDDLLSEIAERGLKLPDRVDLPWMLDEIRECARRRDFVYMEIVMGRIERACKPER